MEKIKHYTVRFTTRRRSTRPVLRLVGLILLLAFVFILMGLFWYMLPAMIG